MVRHNLNLSNFIEIVLKQSHIAMENNEIPVGSIIFNPLTGKLVSKAHNSEISHNDPTAHAEILCIRRACRKLNLKRLDGLELLTYLEPCDMCKEVIKSSRISKVYYLLKNNNPKRKTIFNPMFKLIENNNENLLKLFFKKKELKIRADIASKIFIFPFNFTGNFINFFSTFRITIIQRNDR